MFLSQTCLWSSKEDRKGHKAAVNQREEANKVERIAKEFATRVLELEFSPTENFLFLLEHRNSLGEAVDNID